MKKKLQDILAPMTTLEKIKYIWHYYRYHILGVIVLIIITSSIISNIVNQKNTVLNLMVVGEKINTEVIEQIEITLTEELLTEEERNSLEINLQSVNFSKEQQMDPQLQVGLQKMAAEISAGSVDVLIVDKGFFDEFNMDNQLLSIQELIGKDHLPFPEEAIYYSANREIVGLDISNIQLFDKAIYDEEIILFIPGNTKNREFVTRFLRLITE